MKNYLLVVLLMFTVNSFSQSQNPDPQRFKEDIIGFMAYDAKNSFLPNSVLFAGSSSIGLWNSAKAFPNLYVINRGFGGSHISDQLFYYEDVVKKYKPSKIVFYCGDNDIADGKSADQVVNDFIALFENIKADIPPVKIFYLPIKPSLARWNWWGEMNKANQIIKKRCDSEDMLFFVDIATPMLNEQGSPDSSFFEEDGLHLNENGYALWNKVLSEFLLK